MKILLISPPRLNEISTNLPEIVEKNTGFYPPLGLLYVAASILNNTSHTVQILDAQVENMNYENIKNEIIKAKPDVAGIQVSTFTLVDAIKAAELAKAASVGHVTLGGPHVNLYLEESIALPCVDSIVLGEGEFSFLNLLNFLEGKSQTNKLEGVYVKVKDEIKRGKLPQLINHLDNLSFPSRELIPIEKYYSILSKNRPITTMVSSRGCPYKCVFCDRPHLGKKFRFRSAENVVDEMEICIKDYGIKEIIFYDDTFSINRQRVLNICAEILKRNLNIAWDIRARVDTIDEELLISLKKAGCVRIHYGVESGNPRILKNLRKNISLDKIEEVFKLTRKTGIESLAYFMLGSPGEKRKEIMDTITFATKLNADYAHFSITTPFPSTELYRKGLKEGIYSNDYWKEYAKFPSSDFVPKIWSEYFSREDLVQLLKYANKCFYFRWKYIIRHLFKVSSIKDFLSKCKLAFAFLIDYYFNGKIKQASTKKTVMS